VPVLTMDGVAFSVDTPMKTKRKCKLTPKPVIFGQTGIARAYQDEHPLEILADASELEQRARELRFLAECKGKCAALDHNYMSIHYVAWHELELPTPADMAFN
jgi:hypothetical protein